jgi:hypothetical protein
MMYPRSVLISTRGNERSRRSLPVRQPGYCKSSGALQEGLQRTEKKGVVSGWKFVGGLCQRPRGRGVGWHPGEGALPLTGAQTAGHADLEA